MPTYVKLTPLKPHSPRHEYQVRIKVGGKVVSRSKRGNDKQLLHLWAINKEIEIKSNDEIMMGYCVSHAFERYRDEISPMKPGYLKEKIRLNKFLRDNISNIKLTKLSAKDIEQYIEEKKNQKKPLKSSSIMRDLNLMGVVFSTCVKKWRWMNSNPMINVEKPKKTPARDRRITDDEISAILLKLDYDENIIIESRKQQTAVGFLFAIETAMRMGEIWNMSWNDINFKESYVFLPKTKNGTTRNVALSPRAIILLKKMEWRKKNNPKVFTFPKESCGQIYRKMVKAAGIIGLTFHDTRHEAITRLAKTLTPYDLSRQIGHKDLNLIMIYFNETAAQIAKKLAESAALNPEDLEIYLRVKRQLK